MSQDETLLSLLNKISKLLADHNESEWAEMFRKFAAVAPSASESIKFEILKLLAGMGSLNDVVLQEPVSESLGAANEELNRLRQALFDICRN